MDEDLRRHARAAAQGDVAAEAAHLASRVRAGELSRIDLELAAYVGHAPARVALGPSVLSGGPYFGGWAQGDFTTDELAHSDLVFWIRGLERWGVCALIRALVALGRLALPRLEALRPDALEPRRVLAATEAWCDDPTPSAVDAVEAACEAAATTWLRLGPDVARTTELGTLWDLAPGQAHRPADPRILVFVESAIYTLSRHGIDVVQAIRSALLPRLGIEVASGPGI